MLNAFETSRGTRMQNRQKRLLAGKELCPGGGKSCPPAQAGFLLEAVIESGDRVCLEGNNQKQADFLARLLAGLNPGKVNRLHMVQSVLALPEHIDVFERGLASRVDFSFAGPQAGRVAALVRPHGPEALQGCPQKHEKRISRK